MEFTLSLSPCLSPLLGSLQLILRFTLRMVTLGTKYGAAPAVPSWASPPTKLMDEVLEWTILWSYACYNAGRDHWEMSFGCYKRSD